MSEEEAEKFTVGDKIAENINNITDCLDNHPGLAALEAIVPTLDEMLQTMNETAEILARRRPKRPRPTAVEFIRLDPDKDDDKRQKIDEIVAAGGQVISVLPETDKNVLVTLYGTASENDEDDEDDDDSLELE